MDINLTMELFKNKIVDLANNSGLDIGVVYYIMKDVCRDLEEAYFEYLNQASIEAAEKERAAKEQNQGETD